MARHCGLLGANHSDKWPLLSASRGKVVRTCCEAGPIWTSGHPYVDGSSSGRRLNLAGDQSPYIDFGRRGTANQRAA